MKPASLVPISDFCQTGSGTTPPRQNSEAYYGGSIPWVKSGELRETEITDTEEHVTELALAETPLKRVPVGALLVAMYGATVGRVGILGVEATTNQAVCHIIPDPNRADSRYVFHAFQHKALELVSRGVGGAQPNISQGVIKQTKIHLPSVSEQRRIAAILDQAEELRRLRQLAIERLNRMGQAIFKEMFGDQSDSVQLGTLIAKIESGKNLVADDTSAVGGYRVLKISAIGRGGFNSAETKPLPPGYVPPPAHLVQKGDLLFSRANTAELVGLAAIVDEVQPNTALPDKLWRLLPNKARATTKFLEQVFKQPSVRSQLERVCSGTSGSMKNISMSKLATITVPCPPLTLQEQFEKRLDAVNALLATARQEASGFNRLFASLQHRAFRGEL